jgi:hypothetical protein
MAAYIPLNSLSLKEGRQKYAQGKFIDLKGRSTHYVEAGDGLSGDSDPWLQYGFEYLDEQY